MHCTGWTVIDKNGCHCKHCGLQDLPTIQCICTFILTSENNRWNEMLHGQSEGSLLTEAEVIVRGNANK